MKYSYKRILNIAIWIILVIKTLEPCTDKPIRDVHELIKRCAVECETVENQLHKMLCIYKMSL